MSHQLLTLAKYIKIWNLAMCTCTMKSSKPCLWLAWRDYFDTPLNSYTSLDELVSQEYSKFIEHDSLGERHSTCIDLYLQMSSVYKQHNTQFHSKSVSRDIYTLEEFLHDISHYLYGLSFSLFPITTISIA